MPQPAIDRRPFRLYVHCTSNDTAALPVPVLEYVSADSWLTTNLLIQRNCRQVAVAEIAACNIMQCLDASSLVNLAQDYATQNDSLTNMHASELSALSSSVMVSDESHEMRQPR